jgi:protein-histidine pros-kinase
MNLALFAILAAAWAAVGVVGQSLVEAAAKREVLASAGLMMDSAAAIRAYTATEVRPLLADRMQTEFLPQIVPAYAATQNFLKLHEQHADYAYKEATLNPTNPRDRATDWEADLVQAFRNDARARELSGERDTPTGRALYLARPIRASAECLGCHSVAAAAPETLIAKYGPNNGFGWQAGEIVGAQIVSVPFAAATASAERVLHGWMAALAVAFLAVLALANLALWLIVHRPLARLAAHVERVSVGDASAGEFAARGGRELVVLARAFERLRRSLDKAMKLVGA